MTAGPGTRLKVVFLVGGFPTRERPDRSIFNLRAAKGLAELVDLTVLFIRAWVPGRALQQESAYQGLRVVTATLPVHGRFRRLSMQLSRHVLAHTCRRIFAETDLIHSVGAHFSGVIGSHMSATFGKPHLAQIIGSDVNIVLPVIANHLGFRGWQHRVDAVLANSDALIGSWRSLYPEPKPIRRLYRGTDLSLYSPGPARMQDGTIRFLYLGGLPPSFQDDGKGRNVKGGVTLMDAWRKVESDPAMAASRLVFAGPDALCELSDQWHAGLQHPERVERMAHVPPAEIVQLIRTSSVVILPSLAEGLPNVAVESSACGVPVLGTTAGGIPEVVVDGVTGWLIEPGSVPELSERMAAICRDPERIPVLGEAARTRMESQFDARNYGRRIVDYYNDVLGGLSRPAL